MHLVVHPAHHVARFSHRRHIFLGAAALVFFVLLCAAAPPPASDLRVATDAVHSELHLTVGERFHAEEDDVREDATHGTKTLDVHEDTARPLDVHEDTARSPEETDANVAYFVQIAASTAGHLPRLMRRIHHPRNVYAVHFDMKMGAEGAAKATREMFEGKPEFKANVFIMPSELITYRGVSMVLNTINAMKFLLDRDASWHYFVNLSGSDYPLVSPQDQRRLLGRHKDKGFNFLSFSDRQNWPANVRFRMRHFHVDEALSFRNGPSAVVRSDGVNPLTHIMNFEYTNAEAWMINSRDFCNFVVSDGYARKMLLSFAFSVEASEHYFSTLLWNHPVYNLTIAPRSLRHVIWVHEGKRAGQHPYLVDEKDENGGYKFRREVEVSPNFFIRKFKHADSPLMDFIDSRLQDPGHLREVNNLYNWVVGLALEEQEARTW